MDRGNFFHSVYRGIQQQLGLAFRETKPYALFPLDEYFGGTIQKAVPGRRCRQAPNVLQMPVAKMRKSLRPPLQELPKAA